MASCMNIMVCLCSNLIAIFVIGYTTINIQQINTCNNRRHAYIHFLCKDDGIRSLGRHTVPNRAAIY